ncbi:hypothetical protein GMI70_06345 [Eggerthellaceae bacterium zg-893]|nr:hypothetical protein [Eggerthellaceae bacterium zg-893]
MITFEEKLAWDCLGAERAGIEKGRKEEREETKLTVAQLVESGVMSQEQAHALYEALGRNTFGGAK